MAIEDTWAECDRCGTCVRGVEQRLEVFCKDCAAAAVEAHALADEAVSLADTSTLREGR